MTSKSMTRKRLPSAPSILRWKPHAYMKKAVKFLLEHAAAALFLDPGLGKTSITLAAIKILMAEGALSKVLVIAPLRVCHSTWPDELAKWADFQHMRMVVLHGADKDRRLKEEADIYVINPEGLEWLIKPTKTTTPSGKTKITVNLREFKKHGFDLVVFDELTKFKNYQSVRYKMMKDLIGIFGRRWGLTGSPAANGLLGLFGQMYMIDQGRALGAYITKYRAEYFLPGHDGFSWNLQPDGQARIEKRLQPSVLRMSGEDYLDLPKLIENVIKIDLPLAAMDAYTKLEKKLLTEIEDNVVTAKNAGVCIGKCRQIAGGAIYNEPELGELGIKLKRGKNREWIHVHDAKIEALSDLVEELQGSPLMLAYEFSHELERIREKFGKNVPHIGSGVSSTKGKEIEAAWNRGELPLLVVHPQSVAHGLNMQKSGQHICWFTVTWDYELFDQLIGRLRRQGSVNTHIFCHLLVAKDTVDEYVYAAIKTKTKTQNSLFAGLKKLQARRRR